MSLADYLWIILAACVLVAAFCLIVLALWHHDDQQHQHWSGDHTWPSFPAGTASFRYAPLAPLAAYFPDAPDTPDPADVTDQWLSRDVKALADADPESTLITYGWVTVPRILPGRGSGKAATPSAPVPAAAGELTGQATALRRDNHAAHSLLAVTTGCWPNPPRRELPPGWRDQGWRMPPGNISTFDDTGQPKWLRDFIACPKEFLASLSDADDRPSSAPGASARYDRNRRWRVTS